ncbi:hypothetical protein LINPERPRIM_LOCUS8333, partial [Linum perenne]
RVIPIQIDRISGHCEPHSESDEETSISYTYLDSSCKEVSAGSCLNI